MIVEKITGNMHTAEIGSRSVDLVRLTHDQILKPHQKVTSEGGRVIGISLPEGGHLHNGDILWIDEAEVIAVDLMEEDVFELRPKNNIEWAKAAFNIGNMHQKAYLFPECIRVPYDYVLEKMIDALGVEYSRERRKLDGVPASVSAVYGRHSHGHDGHEHNHDHDHTHGSGGHDHDHGHDGRNHDNDHSGRRP